MDDVFNFPFRDQETQLEPQFLAIYATYILDGSTNSLLETDNDGNGYIGLAPYTYNNGDYKKYNFMWYLKDQGYIDDIVFAIFTDLDKVEGDNKPKSHISLGKIDSEDDTLKDG